MKFRAVIQQDEDGMFVAECPSLPGCISQGKSREETLENVRDAIKGYLESLKKHLMLSYMHYLEGIGMYRTKQIKNGKGIKSRCAMDIIFYRNKMKGKMGLKTIL